MSSFVLKWEFQAIKCHCLKANSFHRLVTFVHRAIIAINLMTSLCFSHYFIFVNNAKHVKGRFIKTKQNKSSALAGVAPWIECLPANQRVAVSTPSQGTCLGFGPGSQEGAHERQPHIYVSLPLFLPPFPFSKNK